MRSPIAGDSPRHAVLSAPPVRMANDALDECTYPAVYAQGRDDSLAERARIALITRATRDRFFHELRTMREIGYIALATSMAVLDVPGFALVVQSPSNPPETLYRHVDAFIERSGAALREMPPAVFERHRAAAERSVLRAETRLGERTARYWGEIDRENDAFDRRERFLEAVRAVTRDEVADLWRTLLVAPETARGIVVAVSSREPPAGGDVFRGAELVADAGAFKRGRHSFDELLRHRGGNPPAGPWKSRQVSKRFAR